MLITLTAIWGKHVEFIATICFPSAILTVVSLIGYIKGKRKEEKECYFKCIWLFLAFFLFGLSLALLWRFGGEGFRRLMWFADV